jgi:DNA-binding MarR family transcriptional regulator
MAVTDSDRDDLALVTEAVLLASRALVAVASRSIAAIDDSVTLPQFRALVVLDQDGGSCNVGTLAQELRIHPSTATRLCDRLVSKGLVRRDVPATNRREVTIALSRSGARLVARATERRRAEIATIMRNVPSAQRSGIVEALTAFRLAAGIEVAPTTVPW